MTENEEAKNHLQTLDALIRDEFLNDLEAAKEIKPNTPEWNFIWNSLHCYKTYAEGKADYESE